MKQSVEVEIADQRLVIRSDEGPQYVQALADYVDAQLRTLGGGRRVPLNIQRVALLVAVQLADELFREKDLHRKFRTRMAKDLRSIDIALKEHEKRLQTLHEHGTAAD